MDKNYSEKLHNVINSKGWNQKKIASELGTSQAHISRILAGTHEPSKALGKLIDTMVAEDESPAYGVTKIIEGLSPGEAEAIRILRECPEALSVVQMMGGMDRDTQKRVQDRVEEQKLMQDMKKAMNK